MEERLAHDVYFTLRDDSPAAREALVRSCHEILRPIDGILQLAAGNRIEEHQRDVNDGGYHVSLHVQFVDRAAHDAYQSCEAHDRFIEANHENWAAVRVFDSWVTAS